MEVRSFRAYVTDALMVLTENTARVAGGRHLTSRWMDALTPPDARTADQIAAELMGRAGLRFSRG